MKKYKVNGMTVKASSMADAIHQVKDGAYSGEFIEVNSASEITLTKIVEAAKNVVKRYGGRAIKIESGRVTGRDKNTLQLTVFEATDVHDYETWSSLPLIFELPYKLQGKLYNENPKYGLQKAMSEITKKLRTYESKTLYEDKTYRMDSLDSEEVEDLATVDKTFLLNLTRKIMSNITSDNFTTAQTQAKELERYINNLGYADSVEDSVHDGRTYTNCVLWLQRALDDVYGYHSVDAISKLNKVIFWLKNDPNFVDSVDDSVNDRAITRYEEKLIAEQLTRQFLKRFDPTGRGAIEIDYDLVPGGSLDKKIVKYLKSNGYKVEWDRIGDDGCYYLTK